MKTQKNAFYENRKDIIKKKLVVETILGALIY